MGSLALSRVEAADRPAPTIVDEVARIARQELAPLAAAIDAGSVYPGELLRRLGEVGAWGSHVPQEGPADLRCAIQSMAAVGEVCGSVDDGGAVGPRMRSMRRTGLHRALQRSHLGCNR